MSDPDRPPDPDRLRELVEDGDQEGAVASFDELDGADPETRKRSLRALRDLAEEQPNAVGALADEVATFLTDEDRAVRLTTAKLFVALARSEPAAVRPVVDALGERLADDDEFYYVRARCAETLGYVAVDSPEAVTDPETLADLRIGLEFDEPEVREKLAKALAYVALGDPRRLRHRVDALANHLDDERELVRYHLCTALVAIGCTEPDRVTVATDDLRTLLDDENPYVRGRAAEGLGLVARSEGSVEASPDVESGLPADEDAPTFLTERIRFLESALGDGGVVEGEGAAPDGLGSVESVREGTDDVVEAMTTADESECPQCGLELPESGPPMCPRCGAPQ